MIAVKHPVAFVPTMARKEQPAARTEQVNFRLKVSTIERMDEYRADHPLRPTMTQIVEAAVNEWLDRQTATAPPSHKKR